MSNQYGRNKREMLKEQCLRYLGGKNCAICGNNSELPCCYDFHHKIGQKEENISKMIARKSKLDAQLKAELDKCAVVCSNCHRQITQRQLPLELLKKLYPSSQSEVQIQRMRKLTRCLVLYGAVW